MLKCLWLQSIAWISFGLSHLVLASSNMVGISKSVHGRKKHVTWWVYLKQYTYYLALFFFNKKKHKQIKVDHYLLTEVHKYFICSSIITNNRHYNSSKKIGQIATYSNRDPLHLYWWLDYQKSLLKPSNFLKSL